MQEEPADNRSYLAEFEMALACLGFLVAVSAMIVTSIPWAIVGVVLMLLGVLYFYFKPDRDVV
jgi:MFS superfamily sulfate permease-like transporter